MTKKPHKLPKRIILSRKGWDSSAGGSPSPIFADDTMMSLPIPDCCSKICCDDLRFPDGSQGVGAMVQELTGHRLDRTMEVHLDPDLRSNFIQRSMFQSAFGQCGQAQFHLHKRGIRKETAQRDADLFLFFGLYRKVSNESGIWRYTGPSAVHLIFGWLQVGSMYNWPGDLIPETLRSHPHAIPSFIVRNELARFRNKNNTVYCARERLTFKPDIAGAGLFGKFDLKAANDPRRLTKAKHPHASQWCIPKFFCGLSNMGLKQPNPRAGSWEPQRKGPGQEFVLDVEGKEQEVSDWLKKLFEKAEKTPV